MIVSRAKKEFIKIIQFTDIHLFSDEDSFIYGVNSHHTFCEVLARFQREDYHNTDFIFLTGDISQDETSASYLKAAKQLQRFRLPIYWIPGNHDHIAAMQNTFKAFTSFIQQRRLCLPYWDFIFLNTKQEGSDTGYLARAELAALQKELNQVSKGKRTAIIMHHHPLPVNTPLVDDSALKNQTLFWSIASPAIQLIICGHVHGDYHLSYNNIDIETAPATCLQWQKGTAELVKEDKIGYKIYHFYPNHYTAQSKIWTASCELSKSGSGF